MDKIYIPNRFKGRIGYQLLVDRYCRAGPEPPAMEGRRLKSWTDSVPDWWPDQDGEYRNEVISKELFKISSTLQNFRPICCI